MCISFWGYDLQHTRCVSRPSVTAAATLFEIEGKHWEAVSTGETLASMQIEYTHEKQADKQLVHLTTSTNTKWHIMETISEVALCSSTIINATAKCY